MAANNEKKSDALNRHVQAYPSPKYHTLVVEHAKAVGTKSEVVCEALKQYFDNMDQNYVKGLLNRAHKNSY